MYQSFTQYHIAKIKHQCSISSTIECTGFICPGEEYKDEAQPPWLYDFIDRVSEEEVGIFRLDRHPDGSKRGWRHIKLVWLVTNSQKLPLL